MNLGFHRAARGLAVSLVGAALVVACGGSAAPAATPATPAALPTTAPIVAATAVPPTAVPPTAAPPTVAPATAAPAAAPVVMVSVVDNRFEPVRLEVAVGTTVRWTNNGRDDHDVVAADFKAFESPLLKAGQTFEATFTQAAQIPYVCTLHDGMTGTLVVR